MTLLQNDAVVNELLIKAKRLLFNSKTSDALSAAYLFLASCKRPESVLTFISEDDSKPLVYNSYSVSDVMHCRFQHTCCIVGGEFELTVSG